jgi:hypothetical protein
MRSRISFFEFMFSVVWRISYGDMTKFLISIQQKKQCFKNIEIYCLRIFLEEEYSLNVIS